MSNNPQTSGAQPIRPPTIGAMNSQNFGQPFPMQFRPLAPGQQVQQYISSPQQYRPAGQAMPLPSQNQPSQYTQQIPSRPGQLGHATPPPSQAFAQPNMAFASGSPQFQQSAYPQASYGQPQNATNMPSQFQGMSQMHAPSGGQPWLPAVSQGAPVSPVPQQPPTSLVNASDWQVFRNDDGRTYYYNKITKQSSWEKPAELMTPLERADASTVWKEFTTPEGKHYYYNKLTKQSKWTIPDELKLAREEAEKGAGQLVINPEAVEQPPVVTPAVPATATPALAVSEPSVPVTAAVAPTSVGTPVSLTYSSPPPTNSFGSSSSHDAVNSLDGTTAQDIEEAKKGMVVSGKVNVTPVEEEKTVEEEPFAYATKQEAKTAFKALLESANVEADWSWEQAMRTIINDKRYGALKSLGEKKQAFNEYMMQRRKLEAEERRIRQRKAKEEFTKMLEESKELTSSTKWSKAITMFEDDARFKAVERAGDREDLYENYLVDLLKKEKAKAQEEYRRNRSEYRQFLETCGLIKVDTQWRKVQDRLEDDERCSRLEKIDRLEVFQEYIRDLEREEDEQRKLKKEQIKRAERRNRDEFRKMMGEHVSDGTLTAKTHWRDYCPRVKESIPYQAVASNTSGSTPKDLFEDVTEELETQYHDDKNRVKDAIKLEKISVSSSSVYEDFKTTVLEVIGSPPISDINLQLVFEDLLERAKEKEEKETKKRQRLAKEFTDKLTSIKEITASSTWEDSIELFEESSEYKSIEESVGKDIFEEHVARLQDKVKEKERKREEEKAKKEKEREEKEKRKEKERKEKEREERASKERSSNRKDDNEESEDIVVDIVTDSYDYKEEKKKDRGDYKDRKHRKRHQSSNGDDLSSDEGSKKPRRHSDDITSDKEDRDDSSKKSRRHGSDRKKSRKHAYTPESDNESRHKKHRRDHREGTRKTSGHEELEDGELGEDGEIR